MWTRVQNKRSYRYFDFASWECFHGSDFNLNAMICRVPLEDGMFFSTFPPILITRRNAFAETPYSSILSWIRCNTIFFTIAGSRSSSCGQVCVKTCEIQTCNPMMVGQPPRCGRIVFFSPCFVPFGFGGLSFLAPRQSVNVLSPSRSM